MVDKSNIDEVTAVMRQINRAWLDDRLKDLAPRVHPDIVMALPGFTGRSQGREEFLEGFRDFTQNATVHEFREYDHQIDIVGETAVINYRYEMVYEHTGERYHATGRDLWVFQKEGEEWLAVWRTMLDVDERAEAVE